MYFYCRYKCIIDASFASNVFRLRFWSFLPRVNYTMEMHWNHILAMSQLQTFSVNKAKGSFTIVESEKRNRCHFKMVYEEIQCATLIKQQRISKEIFAFAYAPCKCTFRPQRSVNTDRKRFLKSLSSLSDSPMTFPCKPSESDFVFTFL